ncbi:permease-like cell division protein FtsX [Hazenella coriacea]|uniref:Cell division protein FtsX n=1 Tax=Hazenella coriacea TaxID=1179467 RepID=A0A4R3L8Y3_9BACL|nr:permease-like cell division protein FtsX [Hazenella coriacea]TCS95668.1 cell division protein FtsX [Hazenella coriacea]
MKIDTLLRHIREAYRGVKRNAWMSFSAISAVAVTLLIFGIFLAMAFNVRFMAAQLDTQMAIRASINPGLSNAEMQDLVKQVKQVSGVKDAQFVSKNEGLRQMKQGWGEDGEKFFSGMDGAKNPLPDMVLIIPEKPKQIAQLAGEIEKLQSQGIDQVNFGEGITDKLLEFTDVATVAFLVFAVGLAVLAAFLISNTIKLTIIARQREIEIQRLVGASNWFIRWPFLIEGAFIGVVGAILPTVFVNVLYFFAFDIIGAGEPNAILKLMPVTTLGIWISGSIFVLGVIIGSSGSIISVRRFLKI